MPWGTTEPSLAHGRHDAHPSPPLRARLILLVALSLLPALGIVARSASEARARAEAQAVRDAMGLVRLVAADHRRLVDGTRHLLEVLSHVPEVRGAEPDVCGPLLAGLLDRYELYGNLGVADPDGDVRCSGLPLTEPVNIADRLYFRRAVQTRGFAIGEYQIGRITGRPGVNFGAPILGRAGQVRGVVFAALDLGWLNGFASRARLPGGAEIIVADGAGTLLARSPDPDRWVGRPFGDAPLIRTMQRLGEGTAQVPGLDDVPRLYAFTALDGIAGPGVSVAVGLSLDEAFAEADMILERGLAALAVAAALGLLGAWVGGTAFVVRPVRTLLRAIDALASGDLSARTGLGAGRGEIAQLARAFDRMASRLQEREAEVRRSAERLRALHEIDRAVLAATSPAETARVALGRIRATVRFRGAGVAVLDEGGRVVPLAAEAPDGLRAAVEEPRSADALGPELAAAVRGGGPFVAEDLGEGPGGALLERLRAEGVRSFAAVPLRTGDPADPAVGFLWLALDEPAAFHAGHLEIVREVADQLAIALAQARLRERQRLHAEELERLVEDLRRTDRQRRSLLSRLVTAQEEERKRLAADIHDDTIQVMTAVAMRLGTLRRRWPDGEEGERLRSIEETAQAAITRLRRLLFDLRPPELDAVGLAPALRNYLEEVGRQAGARTSLTAEPSAEVPPEVRVVAYRIVQEAIRNAHKHARANEIRVALERCDGGVLVRVQDDGVGFEPDRLAGPLPGHLGLTSMRERAESAGGRLEVRSAPGRGTTVECWLPVEGAPPAPTP